MYHIWILPFSTGLAPNRYDHVSFKALFWLIHGSRRGAVWWIGSVYLGEPLRTHRIQILIYGRQVTERTDVW